MRVHVRVTDGDWYRFLRELGATEVNFWQPSGGPRFGEVPEGSPFLFKSKYRDGNQIVGGGFLSGWASLPITRAWEFFGEGNGCATEEEFRTRIHNYRKKSLDNGDADPEIGCIMLNDVRFFNPDEVWDAPPGWPRTRQTGLNYDLTLPQGSYLVQVLQDLGLGAADGAEQGGNGSPGAVPGGVFGPRRLSPVRRGQAAFKAIVQEAYSRRCAVTDSKILPVLQAAHIRPVADDGEHRVDNGLLLRSDVHTLFDRGHLGIHPQKKTLLVSPRLLRPEWGNGEEFSQRAASGKTISVPQRRCDQPNAEFLTWHANKFFPSWRSTG